MADNSVQYLEVVDWGSHLHPDQTRKVKPPYRWVKLQSENLDTLGDLTLREYGAYCRLLNLAALTNNRVVFCTKSIKRRTGITQKDIEKLQNRNLVSITNRSNSKEKFQENQSIDEKSASGNSANPPKDASPEGRGRDKNRLEGRGLESPADKSPRTRTKDSRPMPVGELVAGIRQNGRQPDFDELLDACLEAGVSGSDWPGQAAAIERAFGFQPSEKQHQQLQRQLNDRAGV